jgi:hypothetical protein
MCEIGRAKALRLLGEEAVDVGQSFMGRAGVRKVEGAGSRGARIRRQMSSGGSQVRGVTADCRLPRK